MKLDLENRVALVTGSSKGLGLKMATALSVAGAKVTICARSKEELKNVHESLEAAGISGSYVAIDVTAEDAARKIINDTVEKWGGLDILVNNVGGISRTGTFDELSDQDWCDCFTLNTMTVVRFCREAVPFLRKSRFPRIINIASVVATQPGSYNPHYSASKASIVNLTKYLSNYLAKDGILVNCISPGVIHTEGWDDYIMNKSIEENKSLDEIRDIEEKRVTNGVPLRRLGLSEEISSLAVFLASDASSFMTGDNLRVDGGKTKSV